MNNNTILKKCGKLTGLYMIFFVGLLAFLSTGNFIDECDNFVGGMIIANGGDVYSEHISQHMPILYYICAIFRLLGANSIVEFRLFFYAFLSLIWLLMYIRYNKHFSKVAMIVFSCAYIMCMSFYLPCSSSALSDQLQAQGMVILLLEFLLFIKIKKFSTASYIWIPLSILISLGTAFVSIYGIFVIAIGFLLVDIINCYKDKLNFVDGLKYLIKKYWLMIVLVLSPFVVLIIWYVISGNLNNFLYGAFEINTTIYPKYLNGFGSSPIAVFLNIISGYTTYFTNAVAQITTSPISSIRIILLVSINITFFFNLFKDNKLVAFIVLYFTMLCATRGYDNFHAMAYYAVTIMMASILCNKLYVNYGKDLGTIPKVILALALLIFASSYLQCFSSLLSVPRLVSTNPRESGYAYAINKLTHKDDKIYIPNLYAEFYVESDRIPVITAPSQVPWMYEALGNKELQIVTAEMPKVAVFDKNFEVWNYKQIEYAPEISKFVEANYTNLGLDYAPMLYVRNDLLSESRERLGITPILAFAGEAKSHIGAMTEGREISQVFTCTNKISGVSVMFGTFRRINSSSLKVEVYDFETKELVCESNYDVKSLKDNLYNDLPLNYNFEINKRYEIKLIPSNTASEDFVTIYNTAPNTATDEMYAIVDGVKQNYRLCINLFGENN